MTNSPDSTAPETGNGRIIVFSAPSGAGKTSVMHEILKLHPEMVFSVSVTTRPPRGAEQNGVDYHFVSDKEFDDLIDKNVFVEWAAVHEFRYGTLKNALKKALGLGKTVVMDTDTVGAFAIKKRFPHAILIFIAPPTPEVLFERLKNRHTESPELLEKRYSAVPDEMKRMKEFDYIVVNDTLNAAVEQVQTIITAENLKSRNVVPKLTPWRNYIDE